MPEMKIEIDFYEVPVIYIEGFLSLLRSWLRLHCGISQENFPKHLGLFEFAHNVRKRGKALFHFLVELFVKKDPGFQYEHYK